MPIQQKKQIRLEDIPCVNDFLCKSTTRNSGLSLPPDYDVLAPWVSIDFVPIGAAQFTGGIIHPAVVTVGNQSSTSTNPQHLAVIKNFEFGSSDGGIFTVLIQDVQGGSFTAFYEKLFKDWGDASIAQAETSLMRFQWGWIFKNCDDENTNLSFVNNNNKIKKSIKPEISQIHYATIDSIEPNMSEGKLFYTIIAKDVTVRSFEGRDDFVSGGDGFQGEYMTNAITKLMCDGTHPNIKECVFRKINPDGSFTYNTEPYPKGIIFSDKSGSNSDKEELRKGPKIKWASNGKNKIDIVRSWLDRTFSINGFGWKMKYDFSVIGGRLIIENDINPELKAYDICIGTYLVNGGKDSRVIEFSPKLRWNFATVYPGGGGNLGSKKLNPLETPGGKIPIPTIEPDANGVGPNNPDSYSAAGRKTSVHVSDAEYERNGDKAELIKADANMQGKKAMKIDVGVVEADLTIIGDPIKYFSPDVIGTSSLSIIVINPFYIHGEKGNCEWLSGPVCHPTLTDRNWMINKITHVISSGTYRTIVNVTNGQLFLDK